MAKQTGLGDNLYVGGVNVSNDISDVEIESPMATIEVTGIDKSAYERIGGIRGGSMKMTAFYNPALSHLKFSDLPMVDTLVTYARGTTLGNPAANIVAKQVGYDGKREDDGKYSFDIEAQSTGYGVEWGKQLTSGVRTDTAATNGTSVDDGASTAFGAQVYLHVMAVTGTSVTVTVEHSSDNITFAPLVAFTAATGITWERKSVSNTTTVNRYVRVVTSGTFTIGTFSCSIVRNQSAGVTF
jgi:hypothetical protein